MKEPEHLEKTKTSSCEPISTLILLLVCLIIFCTSDKSKPVYMKCSECTKVLNMSEPFKNLIYDQATYSFTPITYYCKSNPISEIQITPESRQTEDNRKPDHQV